MSTQTTPPNSCALVGIERQGEYVLLAIRDGDQQLHVKLTPRRANLILARLAYEVAEAQLEQEKSAAALADAQAANTAKRTYWRTHADGVEVAGKTLDGANDADRSH